MYLSLIKVAISSSLGIVKNVSFILKDNPSGALYLPVSVWSGSFSRSYTHTHTHTHTHKCMSVYVCACVSVYVCV